MKRDTSSPLLNTITTGDAREICKLLPDRSVDMIFTDPPYPKTYLPLYEWLADEAARVLKPGGFCLAYTGGMYKNLIMSYFGQHLTYFWDFIEINRGNNPCINHRMIGHKSILAWTAGKSPKIEGVVLDTWQGSKQDKRYHAWGQSESTARYYINQLSKPGDIILEPFTGGGTTPYICKQLGRNFIACEIDPVAANKSRMRLATVQSLLPSAV